jgi:hypothetical protein
MNCQDINFCYDWFNDSKIMKAKIQSTILDHREAEKISRSESRRFPNEPTGRSLE